MDVHPFFSTYYHYVLYYSCLVANPCQDALIASTFAGNGEAALAANIVEIEGPGDGGKAIPCVRVFVTRSDNYADTLFNDKMYVQDHNIYLQGLDTASVDIVIDREGYFPVKYAGIRLRQGVNRLEDRVLMYRSSVPFTIPGELGISLKEGITLEDVKPVYSSTDGITIERAPGGYALKIPFEGTRLTREKVERLCRKMVYSSYITDARPYVNLSTVVPGL